MKNYRRIPVLCSLMIFSFATLGFAADEPKAKETPKAPEEKTVATTHTLTIGGRTIRYRATAGTLLLRKDDKGTFEPRASVFFVAYTRDGVDTATRPVTFSFNGGPGSSSVWMHLGLLGPRRVLLKDFGTPLPPPARLVDNDLSLLDATDLVFIDPVSTGFSRPAPDADKKEFHGVREDVNSVGEFIRLWITRNDRWGSPKFLIGESYGTTRAAGLAGRLQEELGIYLNGIMLVSTVLDFQTLSFADGNDLPYIVCLPTYATSAWFHHRLSAGMQAKPLAEVYAEARAFATGEYATALLKGNALNPDERAEIARKAAGFIGLTPQTVEAYNLRINQWDFAKELLRDKGLSIGRYDSRYTAPERQRAGSGTEIDPSYAATLGPMTSALNAYMRSELNYKSDLPYEVLTSVNPWNWGGPDNHYLNLTDSLRRAMAFNPYLNVFVARGYYDLATPMAAAQYTFDHLDLPPGQAGRVTARDYEAGHMMYTESRAREKLSADLHGFIAKTMENSERK